MANFIGDLVRAGSKVLTSKGTTRVVAKNLPKEVDMLFGGIKTEGADIIEIAHKIRTTGNSTYCVMDFQVKDKSGSIIDRVFGSIADWAENRTSYTVKWRKGALVPAKKNSVTPHNPNGKNKTGKIDNTNSSNNPKDKIKDLKKKDLDNNSNINPKDKVKDIDTNNNVGKNKADKKTKNKKDSKDKQLSLNFKKAEENTPKDKTKRQTPIPGVLPPEPRVIKVEPAGNSKNNTPSIVSVRDYEIDGLLDPNTRMNTVVEMAKTGRHALFNPSTGKPNIFITPNREDALDFYLRILGRK